MHLWERATEGHFQRVESAYVLPDTLVLDDKNTFSLILPGMHVCIRK